MFMYILYLFFIIVGWLQSKWRYSLLCSRLASTALHEIHRERRICQLPIPKRLSQAIWTYHEKKQVKDSEQLVKLRESNLNTVYKEIFALISFLPTSSVREFFFADLLPLEIWLSDVWPRWLILNMLTFVLGGKISLVSFT